MDKYFEKSHKLDNVSYDVRGPVLDDAMRMQAAGEHILKLNTGNPAEFGFRAPYEIVRDLIASITDSEGYSDSKGLFSARKAIMQYCQLKGFYDLDIDRIFTGNGVSELIKMCLQALCDPGDEVLVPMPDYPLWTAEVTLAGGVAVHYRCDEQANWYPDIDDMRAKVTDKTKAVVLINPNNPTGVVYPKEVLTQIVALAREKDLLIFADEIYDRMLMDDVVHTSVASIDPEIPVVTLNGLSKSHLVAGFRIGWAVVSGDVSHIGGYLDGLNMMASMRLCSNVLAQHIVQTALGGQQKVQELLLPKGRIHQQRDYIVEAIESIPGLSAVKPEAAFYIFPKIDVKKFKIVDDEKFVLDFLHEFKIMLVHGRGFNWDQPDHFRIVYLPNLDDLHYTADSLSEFLSTYQQS